MTVNKRSGKSYDQYCTIATALDLVGDRWTLLVLRELSMGEARFTDLKKGLPGIATNLLTDRLRDLEEAGLIEQHELPAPAARTVYRLTRDGVRIRPVLRAIAQFGMPYLQEPVGAIRPRAAVFGGSAALFDPVGAVGADLRVRYLIDGEEHWIEVVDGRLRRADTSATPDLTITGTAGGLFGLNRGARPEDVDDVRVEGSDQAWELFRRCFPPSVLALESQGAAAR